MRWQFIGGRYLTLLQLCLLNLMVALDLKVVLNHRSVRKSAHERLSFTVFASLLCLISFNLLRLIS